MKNAIIFSALMIISSFNANAQTKGSDGKPQFTQTLNQDSCIFLTSGRNNYFILEPGYQLVLEGLDGKDSSRLIITVLNETKLIGNVMTRIVEENESVNGKTIEISRNFFAYCQSNESIYYFGEEVDLYKDGKVVGHEGEWKATNKNSAGIQMPGLIMLGARYYQEIAPGIAMDRAEIISTTETKVTKAGTFTNCLKTEETTPLEPKEKEYKLYAPGIGLIQDEGLLLVRYGFVK